ADRPLLAGYARADGLSDPRHAALLRTLNIRYLMVGLDAGSPVSLAALNKPLAPVRGGDAAYRAERMFEHNIAALETAREEGLRQEIARRHERLDIIDREDAMRDHVRALMPGLTLDDLAGARARVRAHCKAAGIVIGE